MKFKKSKWRIWDNWIWLHAKPKITKYLNVPSGKASGIGWLRLVGWWNLKYLVNVTLIKKNIKRLRENFTNTPFIGWSNENWWKSR